MLPLLARPGRLAAAAVLALVLAAPLAAQPGLGFAFRPTPDGLLVRGVAPGSPADEVGLRPDDLVTSMAGLSMVGAEPGAIGAWVETLNNRGTEARLEVRRGGIGFAVSMMPRPYDRAALAAQLGEAPPPSGAAVPASTEPAPAPPAFGGISKTCLSGDCESGRGVAEFRRDGALLRTVTATFHDGFADGPGSYVQPDGGAFEGTFARGVEVDGLRTFPRGSTYRGAFADGVFSGEGTYTFGAGDFEGHTFVGTFADDEPVRGTYTWRSGQTYTGEWDGWTRQGRGVMRYASGSVYDGGWRDGARHGTAVFTFANGMTFTGEWVDDARVRGREVYESGDVYEGEYADDKRHGQGTMTYASGNRYTGAWVAGERHGTARYVFVSGSVYEGEFIDDERTGEGTHTWADGRVYSGDWVDDVRHGRGVMTWPTGTRYEGEWKAGVRSGTGRQVYADGRLFDGTWSEGEPVEGTLRQVGAAPRPVRNVDGSFLFLD